MGVTLTSGSLRKIAGFHYKISMETGIKPQVFC
jgi:hypothetical protein